MNKGRALLYWVFICAEGIQTAFGQNKGVYYYPIIIKKEPNKAFSFTKKWDYPSDVTKDDKGRWEKADGDTIKKQDTAHLYFTANCKTNVQGGYRIRYCKIVKTAQNIILTFSDGLPAYASSFVVSIKKQKFTFEPDIIYPVVKRGVSSVYKVVQCKLTLYEQNYFTSKMLSGYIDADFSEKVSSTKTDRLNKYNFRGYFKVST